VHLLGGAAGPLGGDDLRVEIVVGEQAQLRVVSIAASIALPARSGAASRMTVTAQVGSGGELHWLPEQLIAAHGCHHVTMSNVELADGARLLWREELICGRHGEQPGDVTVSTSVTYAGKPLLRQALQVGPAAVHWAGPGVLGGLKATGCLLGVNTDAWPASTAQTAVRMPLGTGPGWRVTATAAEAPAVRAVLTPARR
jgi:urease accessory protein